MSYLFLIPVSIGLGAAALLAFFWALRHNQYDDLAGAAARVLNAPDRPVNDFSKPENDLPKKEKTDG